MPPPFCLSRTHSCWRWFPSRCSSAICDKKQIATTHGGGPFPLLTRAGELTIKPYKSETPLFFFPGGCAPRTPRSGGRAGGRGTHFIHIVLFMFHFIGPYAAHCFFVCSLFEGLQALGGISIFSHEISCRMHSESCLGTPWGPSYEHICKNVYIKRNRFGW